MDSVLLGLLCLWFVCVGVTVSSVETNVTMGLFSWMDGQHQQDNITTFDEFDQAWSQCDSNNDSSISKEEVTDTLKHLQLGESSSAEDIFGSMDLNKSNLEQIFDEFDNNTDGNITWVEFIEFMVGYEDWVDLKALLDGAESSRGKNGSYILDFNFDFD